MDVDLGGRPRGPLAGVRVLDLTTAVSGPICGQTLGDFGAEVIKVETRIGDIMRYLGPEKRETLTGLFSQFNRNKRGVVLDLKTDNGRDALVKLASEADVLVENYRNGVMDRLGIGYDALREHNPRLVYVAITGFGPEGPYADQPAYDMVIQGMSGFAKVLGEPGKPKLISNLVADKTTGLTATMSVIAALFARQQNGGTGQRIDVPMIDAFASFLLPDTFAPQTFGDPAPPPADQDFIYRAWETADGHVAMLILEDRHFHGLCRALDRDDLIEDERCTNLAVRLQHADELFTLLGLEIAKWPTAELVERAHRHGAPLGPVHDLEGFLKDPQVRSNRTTFEVKHPTVGPMTLFRSAPRFSETPSSLRRLPPQHGEHTREVLAEAGLTTEEIEALG